MFMDEERDLIEQLRIDSDIVTYTVWFPRQKTCDLMMA
jgi:hypothetical protein